jgi:hypothetical protein
LAEAPLTQRIPAIINGISRQAPTIRHFTQCESAENVSFSVLDGFSRRAGTEYVESYADATNVSVSRTSKYRMHKFERDSDLEFVIVYGPGTFFIINLADGSKPTLTISSAASTYIGYGNPDGNELRLVTIGDATFVLNTLRAPRCEGDANEEIDKNRMPMLLVRNTNGTWDLDTRVWNSRPYYQQIIEKQGTPTSGNFKLRYDGETTSAISHDASAYDIEEALEELDNIGDGKIQAFGGPVDKHQVVVNFSPDLTIDQLMTVTSNGTGQTFKVTRGSDVTNPAPKIIRDNLKITDISYFRNRLILAGDEYVVFSQADDLFNFYYEDGNIIIDSDPIEVALAANDVTVVDYVVPHHDSIMVFTKAGQQFQLQSVDVLAPDTASITPSTRYETQDIRPVMLGDNLYFAGSHRGYSIMYEYKNSVTDVSYVATDVTKHVFDLIPPGMVTMTASLNNDTLIVVPRNDVNVSGTTYTSKADGLWNSESNTTWVEDGSPQPWDDVTINHTVTFNGDVVGGGYAEVTSDDKSVTPASDMFVYRRYMLGPELIQSAWTKWSFGSGNSSDNVMDIMVVDNDMYVLTRDDDQGTSEVDSKLLLWKMTITEERTPQTNFEFDVLLDHKHTFTTYNTKTEVGTDWQYTFVLPVWDPGVDTVVLSDDWGTASGTVVTATAATRNASGNRIVTITVAHEITVPASAQVIVGRSYDASVEFSKVYMRQGNVPISEGRVVLKKMVVDHYNAGPYTITVSDAADVHADVKRPDRVTTFTPTSGHSEAFGSTTAWVQGKARDTTITLSINQPKPCTISAIEYHGQYGSLMEK